MQKICGSVSGTQLQAPAKHSSQTSRLLLPGEQGPDVEMLEAGATLDYEAAQVTAAGREGEGEAGAATAAAAAAGGDEEGAARAEGGAARVGCGAKERRTLSTFRPTFVLYPPSAFVDGWVAGMGAQQDNHR